jgi:hypothetical protein
MKIRTGFVSNSSSSSFIVINNYVSEEMLASLPKSIVIGEVGKTQFGWEIEDSYDFESKLNFAVLQARYAENDEWYQMIEEVLSEAGVVIEGNILVKDIDPYDTVAYIDHQSASYEGQNIEMFASKESLRGFLFSDDSYVHTDNDNG